MSFEKIYIKDLKPSSSVHSVFLVREKNVGTDKKGNSFLSLTLSDKTGSMDARIWDHALEIKDKFEIDDFVLIKGTIQKYQNRNQCVVHSLEVQSSSSIQIEDFLPVTKQDIESMFQELLEFVENIQDPHIQELLLKTLQDPEIYPLFKRCPAAKTVHHAYIGGLLEHTLSMCKLMQSVSALYPQLNKDLLIFGCVYHDIGKIWELSYEVDIGYTDMGRLVGHITLGSELIEKKSQEIQNFPFPLKNILKHLVLSHHGKLEYGSPKRPKFLEAFVLSMVDDLDSRLQSLSHHMEMHVDGKGWTPYNSSYDRYFYTDILKNELDKK